MSGAKWQHSTTKSKVGVVTIMDSRIKETIRIVWLMQTYGIGLLILVFPEVKYIRSLLNSYLITYSVWASTAEYHIMGGLQITEIYFLQFWRLGSPRSRWADRFGIWQDPPSWSIDYSLLFVSLHHVRNKEAFCRLFCKGINLIYEGFTFMTSSPPKGPTF